MTNAEIRAARQLLGLNVIQMARMLSCSRTHLHHLEKGSKSVTEATERLVRAYLEGYRSKDWPMLRPADRGSVR